MRFDTGGAGRKATVGRALATIGASVSASVVAAGMVASAWSEPVGPTGHSIGMAASPALPSPTVAPGPVPGVPAVPGLPDLRAVPAAGPPSVLEPTPLNTAAPAAPAVPDLPSAVPGVPSGLPAGVPSVERRSS